MRLRADCWISGTEAQMGCELRPLLAPSRAASPLNSPGICSVRPFPRWIWWSYAQSFCAEQLFREQKSGIFPLENSDLRNPLRDGSPCQGDQSMLGGSLRHLAADSIRPRLE